MEGERGRYLLIWAFECVQPSSNREHMIILAKLRKGVSNALDHSVDEESEGAFEHRASLRVDNGHHFDEWSLGT